MLETVCEDFGTEQCFPASKRRLGLKGSFCSNQDVLVQGAPAKVEGMQIQEATVVDTDVVIKVNCDIP